MLLYSWREIPTFNEYAAIAIHTRFFHVRGLRESREWDQNWYVYELEEIAEHEPLRGLVRYEPLTEAAATAATKRGTR